MTAPFVADSYTRADRILSIIAESVSTQITSGEKAMDTLEKVVTELGQLSNAFPGGYLESIQYINQQAAANPSDEAWQDLKRRSDKLVADYQSTKTRFEGIVAAINSL